MRAKTIVPGLCTALVVLATGVPAHAQWQDRLPPFDQSGVSPGSLGILTMPGDPAPDAADALACAICHAHGQSLGVHAGLRMRKGRFV